MEKPQHPFTTDWYSKLSYDMQAIALEVYFDELDTFNKEQNEQKLNIHSVMQAEGLDEHICKYCGVLTSQPDEDCYKNPNRVQGAAVGNSADGKGVSDGCKHDPYYFMDELLCSKCSARIR